MRSNNGTLVTAFALFSLFFGAGNLILPPFLGFEAGEGWPLVSMGFAVSAVAIPIMGIFGHARLQGTMLDFANKVHPYFSLLFCTVVYIISISLPAPRTAAVTYEMAVLPYFSLGSLSFSTIYFGLVFLFVLNRARLLSLIAKYLTPLLLLMLFMIIGVAALGEPAPHEQNLLKNPFAHAVLEGYQTFDALASIVVGAVVIISLKMGNFIDYKNKRRVIMRGGIIAGIALLLIYAGLIYVGSLYAGTAGIGSRTELLSFISYETLGSGGRILLSALIGVACFTTAVGIVVGTSDFVQGLCMGSRAAYYATAVTGCMLGVAIGQFNADLIIAIAVPTLFFIYPVIITLIVLNVMPRQLITHWVFKMVVLVVILFSIPDFLHSINMDQLDAFRQSLFLGARGLGWVLPAMITFIVVNLILFFFGPKTEDTTPEEPKS